MHYICNFACSSIVLTTWRQHFAVCRLPM